MNDTDLKDLLGSAVASAPEARFDLDGAMRAGRRRRHLRNGATVLSTAAVVAAVAGLMWTHVGGTPPTPPVAGPTPSATAMPATVALPRGVVADGPDAYGVPVGESDPGAPTLAVWFDPQSPLEGALVRERGLNLGTGGRARMVYRPVAFLDVNLVTANQHYRTAESSLRAVAAWGCAVDAGAAGAYLDTLLTHQPATEGAGFSDRQLVSFGADAGISGDALTTFTRCVRSGTYLEWARKADAQLTPNDIPGVPTLVLDGTELPAAVTTDPAKLAQAIEAARHS